MKYHHGFHAGNFADVHKHVALLALLEAMQRKQRGLLYVDTHAGAGAYDLDDAATRHGAEARHGIGALLAAGEPTAPELRDYRAAVTRWRSATGRRHGYPGSPVLAAQRLRPQDRGLCCERQPSECRALERALGARPRVRAEGADGYQQLRAALPPLERRCLALIDPPYEEPAAEIGQALDALAAALTRLANAVIALWYPIKDERWQAGWQRRLAATLRAPASTLELWLYPRDARVALNGSGLLVVNPPYRFAERAAAWQPELCALLGAEQGGSAVQVLVPEQTPARPGATRTRREPRHAGA